MNGPDTGFGESPSFDAVPDSNDVGPSVDGEPLKEVSPEAFDVVMQIYTGIGEWLEEVLEKDPGQITNSELTDIIDCCGEITEPLTSAGETEKIK